MYIFSGESSDTDTNRSDTSKEKKKKQVESKEGKNIDENNNTTECENINLSQDENVVSVELSTTAKKNKRKAPKMWKSDVGKTKRNKGEEYENVKGNVVPGKVFKDYNCLCPLKCSEQVSFESRRKNFEAYYGCGRSDMQTSYISGHIKCIDVDRRFRKGSPSKSRRQKSRYYYLDTDNGAKRVCKTVCVKTLAINSARIHRALIKMQSGCLTDLRGKHKAWNKGADSIKGYATYRKFSNICFSLLQI